MSKNTKGFLRPDKNPAAIILLILTLTGCSVFNPYESEYLCPGGKDSGKCASMRQAYRESRNPLILEDDAYLKNEDGKEPEQPEPEAELKKQRFRETASLIEAPETPLVIPQKTMRVLILNYTDKENNFYGSRYVYFLTGNPEWIPDIKKQDK